MLGELCSPAFDQGLRFAAPLCCTGEVSGAAIAASSLGVGQREHVYRSRFLVRRKESDLKRMQAQPETTQPTNRFTVLD